MRKYQTNQNILEFLSHIKSLPCQRAESYHEIINNDYIDILLEGVPLKSGYFIDKSSDSDVTCWSIIDASSRSIVKFVADHKLKLVSYRNCYSSNLDIVFHSVELFNRFLYLNFLNDISKLLR